MWCSPGSPMSPPPPAVFLPALPLHQPGSNWSSLVRHQSPGRGEGHQHGGHALEDTTGLGTARLEDHLCQASLRVVQRLVTVPRAPQTRFRLLGDLPHHFLQQQLVTATTGNAWFTRRPPLQTTKGPVKRSRKK